MLKEFLLMAFVSQDGTRIGSPFVPPRPTPIFAPECGDATFTASGDTLCIYVDVVNGNDGYDGLYPDHTNGGSYGPKKTIPAAYRIMRTGYPDWMLLKRGQTWSGTNLERTSGQSWTKSGRSSSEPMLISAYGDERLADPIIQGDGAAVPLPLNQAATVTSVSVARTANRTGITWPPPSSATTGWTTFTQRPGGIAKIIYVSQDASANDGNPGTSQALPKLTVAAGYNALANGEGDWLLLERGYTWTLGLGPGGGQPAWAKSGHSAEYPMLIGAYGTGARPKINCADGISGILIASGGHDLAIVGLELTSNHGNNQHTDGVVIQGHDYNRLLIEDCYIHDFGGDNGNGITLSGGTSFNLQNITIRRNVIADMWGAPSGNGANGIYAWGYINLLIEENVIANNGATAAHPTNSNYGHNCYLSQSNDVDSLIFRGNVVIGTDGVQMRSAGICLNNLFLNNYVALVFGSAWQALNPHGSRGTCKGNVVIDGGETWAGGSGSHRWGGTGLWLESIGDPQNNTLSAEVSYNIIANNTTVVYNQGQNAYPHAILLNKHNTDGPHSVSDCHLHHNIIYNWAGEDCIRINGGMAPIQDDPDCPTLGRNWFEDNTVIGVRVAQNPIPSEFLIVHNDGATYSASTQVPYPNSGYFSTNKLNRNVFYRPGSTNTVFRTNREGDVGLSVYSPHFNGVGNTFPAVMPTFPASNPALLTAGAHHVAAGSIHSVTPDGTLATFLADVRKQARFGPAGEEYWDVDLMPAYTQADIVAGSAYQGGVSTLGSLQYFRTGFGMSYPGP